jgi:hypothetical protein
MPPSRCYPVPIGPTLYADLMKIIDTAHADYATESLADVIPPMHLGKVGECIREVARRAYLDGLRDGFVQGVVEREHRPAEWGERIDLPLGGDQDAT